MRPAAKSNANSDRHPGKARSRRFGARRPGGRIRSLSWISAAVIIAAGAVYLVKTRWDFLYFAIADRAASEIVADFRLRSEAWQHSGAALKSDRDYPGPSGGRRIALFKPSLELENYRFEFLTRIEQKGVAWIIRASDEKNYCALRLAVTHASPRSMVSLARHAVVRGRPEPAVKVPLTGMFHHGMPYRVATEVRGARFTVSVEDEVVDMWTEDRLLSGGAGFAAGEDDLGRIYWVKLSRNTDPIGRFCALIASPEASYVNWLNSSQFLSSLLQAHLEDSAGEAQRAPKHFAGGGGQEPTR